jgi:hypothetical protein
MKTNENKGFSWCSKGLLSLKRIKSRVVQNRTNPKEMQIEPTKTETAKNHIWFGCIRILFYQPNQTAT